MNTTTPFRLDTRPRIPVLSALADFCDAHPPLACAILTAVVAGTFALVAHAMGLV